MSERQRKILCVSKAGDLRFVYDDALKGLLDQGPSTVKRASHVEPESTPAGVRWYADLSPVGGPHLSGFTTREDALAAELDWLQSHNIPTPQENHEQAQR